MKGPPLMKKTKDSVLQFGDVGETVNLICEVSSVPVPNNVQWFYNNFLVDSKTEHYQILYDKREDGLTSTLIIRNSLGSDFGDYNCSALNEFGADHVIVTLQNQGKMF